MDDVIMVARGMPGADQAGSRKGNKMIFRDNPSIVAPCSGAIGLKTMACAWLFVTAMSLHAQGRAQPPWHIESFCHHGAPAARRCLVRARQGIIVFQVAELASAPSVSWNNGVAVLTTGTNASSRQLRFFVPPQKLSAPFNQVRAYDVQQHLVAVDADSQLHVRAMFADDAAAAQRDVAVTALPSDIVADTFQASFEGDALHMLWRDRDGHSQKRVLPIRN